VFFNVSYTAFLLKGVWGPPEWGIMVSGYFLLLSRKFGERKKKEKTKKKLLGIWALGLEQI